MEISDVIPRTQPHLGSLDLPQSYAQNLGALPKEQQVAVEIDKQRWLLAHLMIRRWRRSDIKAWLSDQSDDYRQDMARRLNSIENG